MPSGQPASATLTLAGSPPPTKRSPPLGGTESWQLWEAGVQHDARCCCAREDHHGALKELTDPNDSQQTTIYDFL